MFLKLVQIVFPYIEREEEFIACIGYCALNYKKDAFVAKLNSNGDVEWIQSIEGAESEEGIAITVNEIGEVWVLVNSNGEIITVDNNTLTLSREKIWNSSSSIVKLKPDGGFDKMYQLEGDDSYIKKAWINVVGDDLNIIGAFTKGGDGYVDVVGQKIPSKGRFGSSLSLFVNAETGAHVDFSYLGEPTLASESSNVLDVKFKGTESVVYASASGNEVSFGTEVLPLKGEEDLHFYLVISINSEDQINFFQHESEFEGKMALNDSMIVVLNEEFDFKDYSTLFKILYYTYDGQKINEYVEDNPSGYIPNISISDIEIDESLNVIIASKIKKSFRIGTETFAVDSLFYSGVQGAFLNINNDLLLLVVDYKKGLSFTHHIIGNALEEFPVGLTKYGNKIRFMASVQSEKVAFGDFQLMNDNDTRFMYDHGQLLGMYRYENIAFSEFEVLNNVNGMDDVFNNQLSIYPNPSEGKVSIETLSTMDKIEIYSIAGQLLDEFMGSSIEELNYSSGTYLVRAIAGDNVYTQKMIVK